MTKWKQFSCGVFRALGLQQSEEMLMISWDTENYKKKIYNNFKKKKKLSETGQTI